MIEMSCKLIISKRRTFDRVPDVFKNDVEIRLKELGYNTDGEKTTSEE